jgi:hypothetical protein
LGFAAASLFLFGIVAAPLWRQLNDVVHPDIARRGKPVRRVASRARAAIPFLAQRAFRNSGTCG